MTEEFTPSETPGSAAGPATGLVPRALRSALGGFLMGLANVIPGVSGGTMLLAVGIYRDFIESIAELTTLKFRPIRIAMLGLIVLSALIAIATLAGPISDLVITRRWIMYAIFIGLTLGGVPILLRMVRPLDARVIVGAGAGIVVMAAMAVVGPANSAAATGSGHPYAMYLLAGLAAASAMVLPGISGSYLLLILGQYVMILTTVAALKDGVKARDFDAIAATLHVIVPVGIGVVLGVVGVSNVIRYLLARHERATLGVLLGLLLGAMIGLYPFQHGVAPAPGDTFRGDTVVEVDGALQMETAGRVIEEKDWPTEFFTPVPMEIAIAAGLAIAGFFASVGIGRIGGSNDAPAPANP